MTHIQTKHQDLLGFVLNTTSISLHLTMNPTTREDSILILFLMGLTNLNFKKSKVRMQFYQNPSFWRQAINHIKPSFLPSSSALSFPFPSFFASFFCSFFFFFLRGLFIPSISEMYGTIFLIVCNLIVTNCNPIGIKSDFSCL